MTVSPCVAKLPRLMQAGLPQFIDPARFADNKEDISGTLPIDSMQRLHELLSRKTGLVQFELHFDRDERRRVRLSGQYSASLHMQCQRCLQPLAVNIAGTINVALLADDEEAAMLPREVEPLILTGRELSLPIFFEEELLLGLPLAPNHDSNTCRARVSDNGKDDEKRQRPFAALKDFKPTKSKD